jgi:hypothetical protein
MRQWISEKKQRLVEKIEKNLQKKLLAKKSMEKAIKERLESEVKIKKEELKAPENDA